MMKRLFTFTAVLALLWCALPGAAQAQEALKPIPSPLGMATFKYEDLYVKVTYGRPHKRGREVFGSLVPYGKIWRTGANQATEITVTKDVTIGGKKLAAGTYTLFSVPEETKWELIFNEDLGQWGAYRYNEDKDALRVFAEVSQTDLVYEPFTIEIEQKENEIHLIMMWDKTRATIPIAYK